MRFIVSCVASILILASTAHAQSGSAPPIAGGKKSAPASDVSPEILRAQLEQTYRLVRSALQEKDYSAFMRLVIPAKSGKPPPKSVFDQIAIRLLDDYPALDTLIFVKVDRSGAWAGYYTENRVADPDRTDILMLTFKRSGSEWKMSGRIAVQSIPQTNNQVRTLNEISLNPKFRLPGQRGYRE